MRIGHSPTLAKPSNMKTLFALTAVILAAGFINPATADNAPQEYNMVIENHKFQPAELKVPAGKKFIINLTNKDPLAEEFDSGDLKVEKVVAGKSQGTIHIHALDKGSYKFEGEYHAETAQGIIIAE